MDFWSEIVGQERAIATLARAAEPGGNPAHAWLITGPPGSGRSNLAFLFAAALIAPEPAARQRALAQVRAGTHPDCTIVATQKSLITVDTTRALVRGANYSPSVGRYRVIVVIDADRIRRESFPVLLKAIEEPPERTIWLLCAPSEADIPATIRSRTRSLRLVTPNVDAVAALLRAAAVEPELAARAARLAQSHVGMARRLAQHPESLLRRERTIELALRVTTLSEAMLVAHQLTQVAEDDAHALSGDLDEAERKSQLRDLGLQAGQAVPPKLRGQLRQLENEQQRRRKRSLIDGVDRVLTDLLSLYRDVLLCKLGAFAAAAMTDQPASEPTAHPALINQEVSAEISNLAAGWSSAQAVAALSAVETARLQLRAEITPTLVLEALFATVVEINSQVNRAKSHN